jgi:hypothetical protein
MKDKFTKGQRVKHFAFGGATIERISGDSVLLNLDAKALSYYVMGKGRVEMKGKPGKGIETLFCKADEILLPDEPLTGSLSLRASCLAVKFEA